MSVYLIGYDLQKPEGKHRDYEALHNIIHSLGEARHFLYSTWIVKTGDTSAKMKDFLKSEKKQKSPRSNAKLERGDQLLIVKLGNEFDQIGLNTDDIAWLSKSMKS